MKYIMLSIVLCSMVFAHQFHGCALAPDNLHGWAVCRDTSLILKTTDGGITWQSQNPPDTIRRYFWDVTCVDSLRAWATGQHTYYCGEIIGTIDGGITWITQDAMFACYGTRIEFINENYGWVTCTDGVSCMTTDGGSTWQHGYYSILTELSGVSFIDQLNGWIVGGIPDLVQFAFPGIIAHSTDGGQTWDSLYQTSGREDFLDVHFFNQLNGVVVGGNDSTFDAIIFRTTDGGLVWNTIPAPVNAYYLRAVDFVGNEGWAVGNHGTIIYTSDYGDSWVFQDNPAESTLFDVDFSDHLHGLAVGYDTIFYTTDGGQTWLPNISIADNQSQELHTTMTLEIFPNPCRGSAQIKFQIPNTKFQTNSKFQTELKIFDITGRVVKSIPLPTSDFLLPASLSWDGTDDIGRKVPEGIYFTRLVSAEQDFEKIEKIIFLK